MNRTIKNRETDFISNSSNGIDGFQSLLFVSQPIRRDGYCFFKLSEKSAEKNTIPLQSARELAF